MDEFITPQEFDAQRAAMLRNQLCGRGVHDPNVLSAMGRVPREEFVPSDVRERAYEDCALTIDSGQTISQPYMVARMTELLRLRPEYRVLEIGTGSGYQTAVLAAIVAQVYTVEWHLPLMTQAAGRLDALGFRNVQFRCGDGTLGWREHAPFDAILVTAGGPEVPASLREQLAIGARLVIPVGPLASQMLQVVERTATGFTTTDDIACRFVRLVGAEGWAP